MCFYYSTEGAFSILEGKGWTTDVFAVWFQNIQDAKHDFEIKRMILGLSNIIAYVEKGPEMIRAGMTDIMAQMVQLCKKSIRALEEEVVRDEEEIIVEGDLADDYSDEEEEATDPDGDDELEEKEYYESPIAGINEVVYFKQAMESLPESLSGEFFNSLSAADQTDL